MLLIEAGVDGIEGRHQHIGVGGVVVHRATYEQTGKVFVALGKEKKARKVRFKVDRRRTSFREPMAPKLPGQWGLFWETVEEQDERDLTKTLVRTLGQSNLPGEINPHRKNLAAGEEVGGISWRHNPNRFHLNTLRFATEDRKIPPGTDNTACANFIIWDDTPLLSELRAGDNYDMGEVQWLPLDQLLDPNIVFRQTIISRRFPNDVPDSPDFPVDHRVKIEASRFAKTLLKQIDEVNLGCIALRPGILQTLEDLKNVLDPPKGLPPYKDFLNFYAYPKRFYSPKIHDTLLYCPQFGLYTEFPYG